ncbi:MAG: Uma2 family endonuclease [Actinomycetota bacterium]|nr:Uma2 family endonuclease [Actinomycetota bacterium]
MSVQPLDELFAGHAGPWTEEEWLGLPESMGRVELLDGALLVSPHPAMTHQRMVRNLADAMQDRAPERFEIFEGINIRVGAGRILIPDVVVISPSGLEATICEPEPVVLAVEVTSPSNAWTDRVIKPDAYARAGIPNYLRVDLDQGAERVTAMAYSLTPGGVYAEISRSDNSGLLVLDRPFPVELALPILARATRAPRRGVHRPPPP